jgi:hypothetical protein
MKPFRDRDHTERKEANRLASLLGDLRKFPTRNDLTGRIDGLKVQIGRHYVPQFRFVSGGTASNLIWPFSVGTISKSAVTQSLLHKQH